MRSKFSKGKAAMVFAITVLAMLAIPFAFNGPGTDNMSGVLASSVTYYDEQGGDEIRNETYPAGSVPILFDILPEKDEHVFLGWDEDPVAASPTFPITDDYSSRTASLTSNISLYPIWAEAVDIIIPSPMAEGGFISIQYDSGSFTVNNNGTGPEPVAGNAFRVTGDIGAGNIMIDIGSRTVYLLLDTVEMNCGTGSEKHGSIIINGGTAVIQYQGTNTIRNDFFDHAAIRVAETAKTVLAGQGNAVLSITRDPSATNLSDSWGAAIGGAAAEYTGPIIIESGILNIDIDHEGVWNAPAIGAVLGGGPIELNGGQLSIVRTDGYTGDNVSGHKKITLTTSGEGSGSFRYAFGDRQLRTAVAGDVYVPETSDVTLAAVPDPKNGFVAWSGDLTGSTKSQEILNISSDKEIDAQFGKSMVEVTAEIVGDGTGTIEYNNGSTWVPFTSPVSFKEDSNIEVRVTQKAGDVGQFYRWIGGIYGQINTSTLKVVGDADGEQLLRAEMTTLGMYNVTHTVIGNGTGHVEYRIVDEFENSDNWVPMPAGALKVKLGSDLYLRPVAELGSEFIWWTGAAGGQSDPAVIKDVNVAKTFSAEFTTDPLQTIEASTYNSDVTQKGVIEFWQNDAWQTMGDELRVREGDTIKVRATGTGSGTGQEQFLWWEGDIRGQAVEQDILVNVGKTIKAIFTDQPLSKVTAGSVGVEFFQDGVWQAFPSYGLKIMTGGSIDLRASGIGTFIWWTGALSGQVNEQELVADGDKTISAEFAATTRTVTATTSGDDEYGKVQFYQNGIWQDFSDYTDGIKLATGAGIQVRAAVDAGYTEDVSFLWWSGSLYGQSDVENIKASEDIAIDAEFVSNENIAKVDINIIGSGSDTYKNNSIQFAQSQDDYIAGKWQNILGGSETSVTLNVRKGQDLGFRSVTSAGTFLWWTGDLGGQTDTQLLSSITEDAEIQAYFTTNAVYTVTGKVLAAGDPGKVQYLQNGTWHDFTIPVKVETGSSLDVKALEIEDRFIWWTGDLYGQNPIKTLENIVVSKTITAEFAAVTETITATRSFADTEVDGRVQFYQNNVWQDFGTADTTLGIGTIYVKKGADLEVGAYVFLKEGETGSFVEWSIGLSGQVSPQIVPSITEHVDINAVFTIKMLYVVRATIIGDGTLEYFLDTSGETEYMPFPAEGVKVPDTASIYVRAVNGTTGAGDWEFLWWSGALSGQVKEQTITVNGHDASITAEFYGDLADLGADVTGQGKIQYFQNESWQDISVTYPAILRVRENTELTLKAVGTTDEFIWWTGALSGPVEEQTVNTSTGMNVSAVFSPDAKTVTMTTSGTGSGTIRFYQNGVWQDIPESGKVKVVNGSDLTVKAVADTGTFLWWTDVAQGDPTKHYIWGQDSGETSGKLLSTIEHDLVLNAEFASSARTLTGGKERIGTVNAGAAVSGTVEFEQNGVWQDFADYAGSKILVNYDSSMKIRAVDSADQFIWWIGTLEGQDAGDHWIRMDRDRTATAQFTAETVKVTVSWENNDIPGVLDEDKGAGSVRYLQNGRWHGFPGTGNTSTIIIAKGQEFRIDAVASVGKFDVWRDTLSATPARTFTSDGSADYSTESDIAIGKDVTALFVTKATYDIHWDVVSGFDPYTHTNEGEMWIQVKPKGASVYGTAYKLVPNGSGLRIETVGIGSDVKLWIEGTTGSYKLIEWTGDNIKDGRALTQEITNITHDKHVYAKVAEAYEVESQAIGYTTVGEDGYGTKTYAGTGEIRYYYVNYYGVESWLPLPATVNIEKGTSLRLQAAGTSGSIFMWWTGTGVSGQDSEITLTPAADITGADKVTASFVPAGTTIYTISATPWGAPGKVQYEQNGGWRDFPASTGSIKVLKGEAWNVKATENSSTFMWWTGDLSGQNPERSVSVIDGSKKILAEFTTLATYNITMVKSGSGGSSGSVYYFQNESWQLFEDDPGTVYDESVVRIITGTSLEIRSHIEPTTGKFLWWSDAEEKYVYGQNPGDETLGNDKVIISKLAKNITVNAEFANNGMYHEVTVTPIGTGHGKVQFTQNGVDQDFPAGSPIYVADGSDIAITAVILGIGDEFLWWTDESDIDVWGQEPEKTITSITADKVISAEFVHSSVVKVNINGVVTGDGKIQYYQNDDWRDYPASGTIRIIAGSDMEFKAIADSGSVFIGWTGDLSGHVTDREMKNITLPKTITANFALEAEAWSITADWELMDGAEGTVQYIQNGGWQEFPKNGKIYFSRTGTPTVDVKAVVTVGAFLWWKTDLWSQEAEGKTVSHENSDYEKEILAQFTTHTLYTVRAEVITDDPDTATGTFSYFYDGKEFPYPAEGLRIPDTFGPGGIHDFKVKVTPTKGYFIWWTGSLVFGQQQITSLSGTTVNTTIYAEFAKDVQSLRSTTSGDPGSGKVQFLQNGVWQDFAAYTNETILVAKGRSLDIRVLDDTSNVFIWWTDAATGDDSKHYVMGQSKTQTFSNLMHDVVFDAEFALAADIRTLTATTSGAGSGTVQFLQNGVWQNFPSGGKLKVRNDMTMDVRPNASAGSTFTWWTGYLSGQEGSKTIPVSSGNVTFDAEFSGQTYNINVTKSGTGTADGKIEFRQNGEWWDFNDYSDTIKVAAGSSLEIRVTVTGGTTKFIWWNDSAAPGVHYVKGQTAGQTLSGIVHNVSINAYFATSTELLESEAKGTGASPGEGTIQFYQNGQWQDFPAGGLYLPADDLNLPVRAVVIKGVFIWWTDALSGQNETEMWTYDAGNANPLKITAEFTTTGIFTITADKKGNGNGTVQYEQNGGWHDFPASGVLNIKHDSAQALRAVPDAGDIFLWWTGDLSGQTDQQTITVDMNKTVTADFAKMSEVYKIIPNVIDPGSSTGKIQFLQNNKWQDFPTELFNRRSDTLDIRAVDGNYQFIWWTDNKVAEPTSSPVSTKLENNPKQISQPQTGDEAGFIKYIILMLIVALVIAGRVYSLKMRQSEGGKMRKKSRKLRKLLIIILCFASILRPVDVVRAEDMPLPVDYDIEYLTEAPTITNEGAVINTEKYLVLGKEHGAPTTIKAPFDTVLEFPYIHAIAKSEHNDMLPSAYILSKLTTDFDYTVWDLEEYPKLQLPTSENYVLHVGDTIGLPEKAFWGVRKLSDDPYDERFALEHTFGYINRGGERVWAVTRRGRWDPVLYNNKEYWNGAETDINNRIFWKEIVTPDVENVSPLIDGLAPFPAKRVNVNNTGTIADVLVNRKGELGSAYDLVSDIRVFGAVTREPLTLSDAKPIPNKHFSIEHDMEDISHLIEEGVYTAIGIGTVKSKVTDYEDDATIFTQEVIVSTSEKPDINIYRAGTNILYKMEWMSNDQSADAWRQKGLDIQAESKINGNYDLLTRIAGIEKKRTNVDKDRSLESVTNEKVLGWKNDNVDTDEVGVPATSIAYLAKSEKRAISAESDAKYMRFDSVLPTISEVFFADGSWKNVTGHDAKDDLSGLNKASGGVHYLFVKRAEGGALEEIATPTDGKDWASLINNYKPPSKAGEYDLYVYAKDDATNRSEALRLNNEPITISEKEPAKVRLKKEVLDNAGNDSDIFLIHLEEQETILGSVALRRNETSGWMSLDMSEEEFRTIKVTEVVPMDYSKGYRIYVTDGDGNTTLLDEGEDKVTLEAGDEITITIENEFEHAGYFRDKVAVENIFIRWL